MKLSSKLKMKHKVYEMNLKRKLKNNKIAVGIKKTYYV